MNYGDKHTEDSLSLRLGRLYGIERGLDCGPNIIMDRYWKIWDGGERHWGQGSGHDGPMFQPHRYEKAPGQQKAIRAQKIRYSVIF